MKTLLLFFAILSTTISLGNEVLKSCKVKSNCTLRELPTVSKELMQIKKGENVDVLDFVKGYFMVNYNGITGYLSDVFINDPELNKIITQRESERQAKENEEILAKEEQRRTELEQEQKKRIEDEKKQKIAEVEKQKADEEWRIKTLKQARQQDSIRKEYLIKNYGKKSTEYILQMKVFIGMSSNEAYESQGRPADINKTTTAYGINEQWVYMGENYKSKYLYFENGILKTIQE